jgi:hypothetical protein
MENDWTEEDFPLGDGVADTEAEVVCPYCGEVIEIGLDPGSGAHQQYVEDCEVCCRPWSVHVHFHDSGTATVEVHALDE